MNIKKICYVLFLCLLHTHVVAETSLLDIALERQNSQIFLNERIYHILVRDKKTADKIYKTILVQPTPKRFEKFKDIAINTSIDLASSKLGGDLGFNTKGDLPGDTLNDFAFELPVNQISHPIESKYGWHLFYVTDRLTISPELICQKNFESTINQSSPEVKALIEQSDIDIGSPDFARTIIGLLKGQWGSPLKWEDGSMLLINFGVETDSDISIKTVIAHFELPKPITAQPIIPGDIVDRDWSKYAYCYRSYEDNYKVNCSTRKIGFTNETRYQFRAALGKVVQTVETSKYQTDVGEFEDESFHGYLYKTACLGKKP